MSNMLREIKWNLFLYKSELIMIWGLKNGYIRLYDDKLIEKLRNIYYGGIPASIILLSKGLSNGQCYDRSLLMSRAFLNEDADVNLIYATVDSLKLNPKNFDSDPLYADHCFVERITKNNEHLIYDTTDGLIYDKKLYWLIENPKVRKINDKNSIIKFLKAEGDYYSTYKKENKDMYALILSMVEDTYNHNELYPKLLQREIDYFKELIDYDDSCKKIKSDINRLMKK